MKKINPLFLAVLCMSMMLYSCQREIQEPNQANTVSSKDPAKLSSALKVWHGTRTTGTMPAATGTTPAIDPTVNPTVKAFAGRYAIIKPEVTAGVVAGYYIGIPGAGQYFNLDFSKPRDIAGRGIKPTKNNLFGRLQTGTADSSIVIVIPGNIQLPDTFCVTYYPYDASGNIGQPVTTCVIVTGLGAGSNNGWLQNDFRVTSSWDLVAGVRINIDTVIYNQYTPENNGYYCDNTFTPPLLLSGAIQAGQPILVDDSTLYTKNNIRFALNGGFDYTDQEISKTISPASTCSSFIFITDPYNDFVTGGYSFNATTNKIVFIWEFDAQGVPEPDLWEYEVIKINDNHFILRDPTADYYIRFQR